MKIATSLLVVLTLGTTGCAVQRAQVADRAQTELVGMSKKDLMVCAGVPIRQERIDDLELLTYGGGGDSTSIGTANAVAPGTAVGVSRTAHRYCEATFVLKDGKVQKVNYQGRTGGLLTKGEQCAFIVENCVKK
jgi:hypothetical protein